MAADQIGVSGDGFSRGIPASTVAFGTTGNQTYASATSHSLTIFSEITKNTLAERKDIRDLNNEVINKSRTNKRVQIRFSAKPMASTVANSLAIAADVPQQDDVLKVTCATDAQVDPAGTGSPYYVDDCQVSYTPDNEIILTMTATRFANTFVVIS